MKTENRNKNSFKSNNKENRTSLSFNLYKNILATEINKNRQ